MIAGRWLLSVQPPPTQPAKLRAPLQLTPTVNFTCTHKRRHASFVQRACVGGRFARNPLARGGVTPRLHAAARRARRPPKLSRALSTRCRCQMRELTRDSLGLRRMEPRKCVGHHVCYPWRVRQHAHAVDVVHQVECELLRNGAQPRVAAIPCAVLWRPSANR